MKRLTLALMLAIPLCGACRRTKAVDTSNPFAAQQSAARDRAAEQRPGLGVKHDPDDTFSVNSMGSD
jgi:hypothetical protein